MIILGFVFMCLYGLYLHIQCKTLKTLAEKRLKESWSHKTDSVQYVIDNDASLKSLSNDVEFHKVGFILFLLIFISSSIR